MVKKIILTIMLLALAISLVSAVDTEIKVKTLPDHKVFILIYSAGTVSPMIDSFDATSDSNGEVSFVNSVTKSKIDVLVKVTKDGQKIFLEKFEDYETGEPIYIRIDNEKIDGTYTPNEDAKAENTTNTTSVEENNTDAPIQTNNTETIEEKTEPISGAVVSEGKNKGTSSTIIYGVIIGLLVVAIAIFALNKVSSSQTIKRKDGVDFPAKSTIMPTNPSYPSSSQSQSSSYTQTPDSFSGDSQEAEMQRVEYKIREAQQELARMKNQERIKAAEAKLEVDRRELEKLRKGY